MSLVAAYCALEAEDMERRTRHPTNNAPAPGQRVTTTTVYEVRPKAKGK